MLGDYSDERFRQLIVARKPTTERSACLKVISILALYVSEVSDDNNDKTWNDQRHGHFGM